MKKKPGVNAGLNGMVIACAVPRCWERVWRCPV
ncbi:hypothetical protein BRPE67_BCDS07980 [Caballeronia cordobensis]|nr:hypothetical protein BRPE67_BCDS07980 [Burkholderia sp. RPE67]